MGSGFFSSLSNLQTLSAQGILAVMLVISFYVNYLLYKENKELQEKRVDDAQNYQKSILEPMKMLQQTLDLVVTLLKK
jgi:hypothetical protein